MLKRCPLLSVFGLSAILASTAPGRGQTIINEWSQIKAPSAPELKAVAVDPRTTALLMLDFVKQTCNQERRPRCLVSVEKVKNLLVGARAKDMLVVYSISSNSTLADTLPVVAPTGTEPVVQSGADKFYKTNLEQVLKDKNIQTVIVVGTAAHGAVMYTGSEAAIRGMKVIVPVDGMSAENPYIEQYVAYNFTAAPGVGAQTTLTSIDLIKF